MNQITDRLKQMTPLQRAVYALKETQTRLEALEKKRVEPIAVVGMACRFPGEVNDPASFWQLLRDGVDAIGEIPADRWNADDYYDPDPASPGKMSSRSGGFLSRIDEFDNHFFGISDGEALQMDPQQRILLELVWETLEDAGIAPLQLRGSRTGVFVGISSSDYFLLISNDASQTNAYVAAGTSLCLASNRLSYALGLQGPSISLDTACSSSLVAVHLACQQIRLGECDAALVGGANLLLSPIGSINLTKAGFCSSDGRIRAFDAGASGYVRSEGVGMIMLKPLSVALKDKDPIYCIIRGSATNQNGSSNGISAPSRLAQEQVLREAYARAQVSPGQVGFVETQGTGTRLGDIIEATALGHVMQQDRVPGSRCVIGALKTNLGHLEAASGMASLIKASLALKYQQVPRNLHFETANPEIPFDKLPLQVPQSLQPWPCSSHPRYAGVSAFGFGGSNAHVVLQEPPLLPDSRPLTAAERAPRLLPLSAKTEAAREQLAKTYITFLSTNSPPWPDVCYTASERRQHHDCRLAVLASSQSEAAERLSESHKGSGQADVFVGRKPYGRSLKLVTFYTDDAESWKQILPRLMETLSGFAAAAQQVDSACLEVAGWSLLSLRADDARWSHPPDAKTALVAAQLALTAWWRSLGVIPDVVLGHGLGELAAAAVAGLISPETALCLAADPRRVCDVSQTRSASLPFLSVAYGKAVTDLRLDLTDWRARLDTPQNLAGTIRQCLADRIMDVFLEVGPSSLSADAKQALTQCPHISSVIPSFSAVESGGLDVMQAIGILYASGVDIDWTALAVAPGHCVRIPTYPWQRQRLWAPVNHARKDPKRLVPVGPETSTPAADTTMGRFKVRPDLTTPYESPRTPLEQYLSEKWSEILGVQRIGVYDNFFELGGDSLQATMLLNQLIEQMEEAVPIQVLFQVQCIRDLAEYLQENFPRVIQRNFADGPSAGAAAVAAGFDAHGDNFSKSDSGVAIRLPTMAIPRRARDSHSDELLARLDDLDDDELNSMLRDAVDEENDIKETVQ